MKAWMMAVEREMVCCYDDSFVQVSLFIWFRANMLKSKCNCTQPTIETNICLRRQSYLESFLISFLIQFMSGYLFKSENKPKIS